MSEALKLALWSEMEKRHDELVALCAETIRIESSNPPGDTTAIAAFVGDYLTSLSLNVETYAPAPLSPNLVASTRGAGGRHLVFNSHLDTFPAAAGEWTYPPFSGFVEKGRIYGCGASDMKAGLAISLFAAKLLAEVDDEIPGRVTFSYSSDEETGGRWGTEWMLANVDSINGDACVIGDQNGSQWVAIGEKGFCWLRVSCRGTTSHAAYGSSSSAIRTLTEAIPVLYSLEDLVKPSEVASEADAQASSVTVNVGRIEGGVSPNLVAGDAWADADIRIPHGTSPDEVLSELRRRLGAAGAPCDIDILRKSDSTLTEAAADIVKIALRNCRGVLGRPVDSAIRVGASDARFFRQAGIPAIVYGPEPHNMGAPDEYVDIEELLLVARVHVGIAVDFAGTG